MYLPLKIGGFALLVVGASGSGIWILVNSGIPEWRPLSTDSSFETSYNGKYAENYGNYLVGVGEATNKEKAIDNTSWWEWSYKNKYLVDTAEGSSRTPKKKFEKDKVTGHDKLKEQCKCAYEAESSNVKKDATSIQESEWYKEDIWRYCSPYPTSPKTVEDAGDTDYTSKFGSSNKTKLASTKEDKDKNTYDNDWFWELKGIEFFTSATNPINNTSKTDFKDLYSKKDSNDWAKKLRDTCESVYKQDDSNLSSEKTDIFKWCSFKGKE